MTIRALARGVLLSLGLSGISHAEIKDQFPGGFTSAHTTQVAVSPRQALQAFGQIGRWWDPQHSFSGQSKALKLDLRLGGCFCERAGKLQVKHLDVLRIEPDRRIVLQGGLGPLQTMAVQAVMEVEAIANSQGSELRWTYRVSAGNPSELEAVAKPVDQVIAMQFQRWIAVLE
jgi:hypothetical protein